jgi:hypothetical protein
VLALLAASALHADVPAWVREAAAMTLPAQSSSTDAVVLLDEQLLTERDPDVTLRHRRVLKILTAAGRDHAYAVEYYGSTAKVLSMRGWIIDASEKTRELRERDAVEGQATSYELYSDVRRKVLSAADADIGSIVAFETEVRSRPVEKSELWQFQESIPVLRARFSIDTDAGYATTWVRYPAPANAAGPAWELRDIPAVADEPRMPSPRALAGWMGISWGPKRTWSDIGKWYAALAAPRLAPAIDLTAKAKELGEVGACARFAQFDVRYVAVEIGIGGYQPHAAADVFRNRYGDCKDKATLLRAMLKERGVESRYVLVNATRGATDPSFPTLRAFNHVILAIRDGAKTVYFDPTSTLTPYGLLPDYLQGSHALLVADDGGELVQLPVHAPDASELRRVARLQLDAGGALRGTIEETRTGSMAASMRGSLEGLTAAERIRFVETLLSHHLGSHTTSEVEIEHLGDVALPLVIRYTISAGDYAKRVADLLLVRPRVVGAKSDAPIDTARHYAYVTEGPSLHTDDVEIVLPSAATLDELPKPVRFSTPHLDYTSESSFENGVLRYKRRYVVKSLTVPAAEVGGLNEAFAKIAADERASAVFR